MNWKLLCSLAVTFTIFHYGPMFLVYAVVALGCFFLGLLISMDKEMFPDIFQRHKCSASKGIPAVTAIMDMEGVAKPNIKLSNTVALDAVCNQIISYILRDYIYSWYGPLTPDTVFPTELHRLLQQIMFNLIKRISQVNWIPFLTETLPSDLASHVRIYRTMLERQKTSGEKDYLKVFFDCEADLEKAVCREDICTSSEHELEYLRRLSEMFLFFILPCEEYRVPAIRYIARELLVTTVLVPTIDLLCDPDFVNRSVAWFAKDNAFTSEHFIQALKLSDSPDELEVVIQQANGFTEVLRGRDTGGDDDIAIKAQLGSVDYVRKICSQRLEEIQAGMVDKPDTLTYNIRADTKLYDMSFKELMSTSVSLVSFLDFLTSIDRHQLLRLYLNCMSYRESAQHLPELEKNTTTSEYSPSIEPCDLTSEAGENQEVATALIEAGSDLIPIEHEENGDLDCVDDPSCSVDGTYLQKSDSPNLMQGTLGIEESTDSLQQSTMVDDLRAFGVLLCGNLLKQLPTSVEPLVQQVLRTITITAGPPDPDAFSEVEAKLTELLSDDQCFGAFKKSPQYVQLLAELDLLRDPSELTDSQSPADSGLGNDTLSGNPVNFVRSSAQIICKPAPDTYSPTATPSISQNNFKSSPVVSSSGISAMDSFLSIFKQNVPENESRGSDNREMSENLTNPASIQSTLSELYTAVIVRSEIMRDSYVAYTIRVSCTPTDTGNTDTWQTLRRFSNFVDLHSLITDRCGNIPRLKLPSKRAFSNMNRDFLAKRRRELNEYLAVLCSTDILAIYPQIRSVVMEFLQPDTWERGRAQARMVASILNPLKTMSNAMKAVPDTLADGFSRMFPGLQAPAALTTSSLEKAYRRSASFDTGHVTLFGDLDPIKGEPSPIDDSPIGKIFLLVDEIFNLQQKNHLSREGNFVILRKIFHPLFGPRINKMIISKVREYTSAIQMAEFLAYLRDTMWPPTDPTKPPIESVERSRDVKLRTRVLCRTMLLGSLSEELAQFLGNETTRRGAARAFRLLQETTLNRRFVHHLLQAIILHMFGPCRAQWEAVFEKHLCPLKTGRSCRIHTTQPE